MSLPTSKRALEILMSPSMLKNILFVTLKQGTQEEVQETLTKAEEFHPDVINYVFDGNMRPLHIVAQGTSSGALRLVLQEVIKKGGNPNQGDKGGFTALHYAAGCGKKEMILELLKIKEVIIDKAANKGHTPLSVAVGQDAVEAVELLLEHGAQVTKQVMDRAEGIEDPIIKKKIKSLLSAKKTEKERAANKSISKPEEKKKNSVASSTPMVGFIPIEVPPVPSNASEASPRKPKLSARQRQKKQQLNRLPPQGKLNPRKLFRSEKGDGKRISQSSIYKTATARPLEGLEDLASTSRAVPEKSLKSPDQKNTQDDQKSPSPKKSGKKGSRRAHALANTSVQIANPDSNTTTVSAQQPLPAHDEVVEIGPSPFAVEAKVTTPSTGEVIPSAVAEVRVSAAPGMIMPAVEKQDFKIFVPAETPVPTSIPAQAAIVEETPSAITKTQAQIVEVLPSNSGVESKDAKVTGPLPALQSGISWGAHPHPTGEVKLADAYIKVAATPAEAKRPAAVLTSDENQAPKLACQLPLPKSEEKLVVPAISSTSHVPVQSDSERVPLAPVSQAPQPFEAKCSSVSATQIPLQDMKMATNKPSVIDGKDDLSKFMIIPNQTITDPDVRALCKALFEANPDEEHVVGIIGGELRDKEGGVVSKDVDIIVDLPPKKIVENLNGRILGDKKLDCKIVGEAYPIAVVRMGDKCYQIGTFRKHRDIKDGRQFQNEVLVRDEAFCDSLKAKKLTEELILKIVHDHSSNCDFSYNTLFLQYGNNDCRLIVHQDAFNDSRKRLLRCVGDAVRNFSTDPIRMLRGANFVARFRSDIDPETKSAFKECAKKILNANPGRVIGEIQKILDLNKNDLVFCCKFLREMGLYDHAIETIKRGLRVGHRFILGVIRTLEECNEGSGCNALHAAIADNNEVRVQLLLDIWVNPYRPTKKGVSAFDLAGPSLEPLLGPFKRVDLQVEAKRPQVFSPASLGTVVISPLPYPSPTPLNVASPQSFQPISVPSSLPTVFGPGSFSASPSPAPRPSPSPQEVHGLGNFSPISPSPVSFVPVSFVPTGQYGSTCMPPSGAIRATPVRPSQFGMLPHPMGFQAFSSMQHSTPVIQQQPVQHVQANSMSPPYVSPFTPVVMHQPSRLQSQSASQQQSLHFFQPQAQDTASVFKARVRTSSRREGKGFFGKNSQSFSPPPAGGFMPPRLVSRFG